MWIGLTGGIGCGKSMASRYLEKLGYVIIDCDIIARELVEPNAPLLKQLCENFGQDILTTEGLLDRAYLGKKVFADPQLRNKLDQIMHPAIIDAVESKKKAYEPLCGVGFVVAPLLFEANMESTVDQTWLVTARHQVRLERITKRDGFSPLEAEARIESQMSEETKRKKADVIIENNTTPKALYKQIDAALDGLK